MKSPAKHRKNQELRQQEAFSRQAATDMRTPQQRLDWLDMSLGVGQGAQHERAKLAKLIAAK